MTDHVEGDPMRHISRLLLPLSFLIFCLRPHFLAGQEGTDCFQCHGDPEIKSTFVDINAFKGSVHADLSCTDCHAGWTEDSHPGKVVPVKCGTCHDQEEIEHNQSVHGAVEIRDPKLAPTCASCHGTHQILPMKDPNSLVNPARVSETCGACHSHKEIMDKTGLKGLNPYAYYEQSAHSRKRVGPNNRPAATCVDCHNAHAIYPPLKVGSTIGKAEIPNTCGRCHKAERTEFEKSIHWTSVNLHGNYVSPVCNDCHGEHSVTAPGKGESSASEPDLTSVQVCANCHSNTVLMSRFGLDAERMSTYMQTYHGLAVRRGSPDAARCVSCHEVHAIRSKSDPKASVHPDHVLQTCQKCHPGAGPDFTKVAVHPANQKERNPIAWLLSVIYIWLICLTIGGMLVHNAIIMLHYIRKRLASEKDSPQVQRFKPFEVIEHMLLLISFGLLTLTGFALKFPEAGWVQWLNAVGMSEIWRAWLHRAGGILLVAVSIVHGIYMVFSADGRREVIALIPRWYDITDCWQSMRFHLGYCSEHPKHRRFSYSEKAEYLALIWGVLLMALTGFILWFPHRFVELLPAWTLEVAEVVHFYEAILAVLAICVWHFFFVIFHPAKYPFSTTLLHGRLSEEEWRAEHPLEEQPKQDDSERKPTE